MRRDEAPMKVRRGVRALLVLVALAGAALFGARAVYRHAGCTSSHEPSELAAGLGAGARALLDDALRDLDPSRLVDYHAHVCGLGAAGSGCFVNEQFFSFRHPWRRFQFSSYLRAARITDLDHADEQFVARLTDLLRGFPLHGRACLLAFDKHYRADGTVDDDRTDLFVPDEYVWKLAAQAPDLYAPVISVHPYRTDALDELDRFGARGVRLVKWLPNAMGIDPSDARCDAFYARMKRWSMTLLAHTGDEQAVDAGEAQMLGNPLRLRRALDAGVRVIFAHCATVGVGSDLDDPEHKRVANFDLFLRVMGEKRYEGLAFGEISAVTTINRSKHVLATLLARTDLSARLVNGSDYPLPAIDALYSTRKLQWDGFLTSEERARLNEIYDYNPLLFDLVLKRTIHEPGSGARFPASVFLAKPELGP
jgi:predicted TIM-barrel fold metal-dependent hydrolase